MPCGGRLFISYSNNLSLGEKLSMCKICLAVHQSAEEYRWATDRDVWWAGVGWGLCGGTMRSEGFSTYSLSNKTNGLPLPRMTANCGHKALYNHDCDYATFRRHLSCVWSPSWKRGRDGGGGGGSILGGIFFFLLIKLVSLCRAPALFITEAWDPCESLRVCASMCVLERGHKQCAQQSCHT